MAQREAGTARQSLNDAPLDTPGRCTVAGAQHRSYTWKGVEETTSQWSGEGGVRPTILGLMLLPVFIGCVHKPMWLLQITLVVAVFDAAAAVVIGGFGLPLAMVPGLLFAAYVAFQYMLGMRYPGERIVLWATTPLLLLLAYALISAMLIPDAFAGKVMVWPQKPDPVMVRAEPLAPTAGNVTQSLYLLVNVTVTVLGALYLTLGAVKHINVLRAYMLAGYGAVFIALWDLARRTAGVPFPRDVFLSNPGWAILDHQAIGTLPRISGSFAEPSSLGSYLAGVAFCCLWLAVQGHNTMRPKLLLALSLSTVLLSTSTTGLVLVFVGLPSLFAWALYRGRGRGLQHVVRAGLSIAGGAAVVLTLAFLLRPEFFDALDLIIESTLSKQESESYLERTAINWDALVAMTETYGLGTGWGSFRAMSLIPSLLANAGVFGLAMLLWYLVRVSRLSRMASAASAPNHPRRVVLDGLGASLLGQVAGSVIAGGFLSNIAFSLQMACVIGVAARMVMEERSPAARRPAAAAMPLAT